ncbi:MAG TPA: T9SS type A sorting domain-containing protein [Bacteroidales bacterium]|nr:T9SS type A sorting domain-containing protein [Bacteroidales bacterium]
MKKIILLPFILLALFSLPGTAQVAPVEKKLDSVYRYDWNSHNSAWALTQKEFKEKNGTGQLSEDQTLNYDSTSGQWVVIKKMLYQYFSGSDSVSQLTGEILNIPADTFAIYLFTHYTKPGLPDEYFLKTWDQGLHQFVGGVRTLTTYNGSDSITQVIQQVLDIASQLWVNATRDTYTRDAAGNPTQRLTEYWLTSFSTWTNNERWTYTYDAFSNLTGILQENWDPVGMLWRNASRTTLYVKGTGQIDSLQTDSWSVGPQTWIPVTRSSFIYSVDGLVYNRKDQVYNQGTLSWNDHYLTLYTYFSATTLVKTISGEFWKSPTFNWIKNYQYRNDSVGHEIELYEKYWDPVTYVFTSGYRNAWTFNSLGQETGFLSQSYDSTAGTWANISMDTYTFTTDALLSEDLYQVYSSALQDWVNSRKYEYYYNEFIGIPELQPEQSCFHANPMKEGSPVTCPSFTAGRMYDLSLYSLSGSRVYSTTFTGGSAVMLGQGLPEGMYLMRITSGGKEVYRDKVILVR